MPKAALNLFMVSETQFRHFMVTTVNSDIPQNLVAELPVFNDPSETVILTFA